MMQMNHEPFSIKIPSIRKSKDRVKIVDTIPEFMYLPRSMILASYGGGDEMQIARQILNLELEINPEFSVDDQFKSMINACIDLNRSIPKDKRVAHLPEQNITNLQNFKSSLNVQISSQVYGEEIYNIMYQV